VDPQIDGGGSRGSSFDPKVQVVKEGEGCIDLESVSLINVGCQMG
jgi:hypothetical protein